MTRWRSVAGRLRPPVRGVVAVCALAGTTPAAAQSVRAEGSGGFDTNVTRVEDEPGQGERRSDGLVRAVLELQDVARPAREVTLSGGWHLGAKHFFALDGEDTLLQRVDGGVALRLGERAALRLDGHLRDRSTRDPERPRDFTDFAAGPGVEARVAELGIVLRGFAGRFLYAPDPDLSSRLLGASLRLSHPVGPITISAGASRVRRDFEGDRLISAGGGGVVIASVAGEHRRDDVTRLDARIEHVGAWIGQLEYAWEVDESNNHGAGFERHVASASAHVEAPLGVLASAQASLQRIVHADPQRLTPEVFVEDEDRSAVSLRLERPLTEGLSAVAHGALQFSPSGTGPTYDRQTVLVGLAYGRD